MLGGQPQTAPCRTAPRPVSPNDLHATLLRAFGIDQRKIYYMHNNRKELVTVNGGEVVTEVFG